jgi:predicted MFS family arabinose efflux permease
MAMGWLNVGFSLAAIAGVPLIGALGGLFGWRAAFAAVGASLLVLATVVRLAFPAPPPSAGGAGVLATYRVVFGVPRLGRVLAANLLERTIFNAATLYLPPFLILSYGLTPVSVAPALSLVALGSLAGNLMGGWLGDRRSRAAIFVVAQALAAIIGAALFGLPAGLAVTTVAGTLFGLANAASRPAFLALGSELSSRHRGAVLGVVSLTNQAGIVVGSALGGLIIGLGGYPALAALVAVCGLLASACAAPLIRPRG